jgi:hypothetical protein
MGKRRLARMVAGTVLGLAIVASGVAGASARRLLLEVPGPGPVAVGSNEIFYQHGTSILEVAPGGSPRVVTRVQGPLGPSSGPPKVIGDKELTFAASAGGTALLYTTTRTDVDLEQTTGSETLMFFAGQPPAAQTLRHCVHDSDALALAYAVSDSALAYESPPCPPSGTADSLVVHDLGGAPDVTIPLPANDSVLSTAVSAGSVAAVLQQENVPNAFPLSLVVWDSSTGAERYHFALGDHYRIEIWKLAVDSDGSAAWISSPKPSSRCATLSGASPSAPSAHPLSACVKTSDLAAAGGRIVYQRRGSTGTAVVSSAFDGSASRVSFPSGIAHVARFTTDTILTSRPSCDGRIAVESESAMSEDRTPVDLSCRGVILTRRARVRRRSAQLRVRCPSGCVGAIDLDVKGRSIGGDDAFTITAQKRTATIRVAVNRMTGRQPLHVLATLSTNRLPDHHETITSHKLTLTR